MGRQDLNYKFIKPRTIFISVLVVFITIIVLGLNYSNRFNNYFFSYIVNPYDPFKISDTIFAENGTSEYWNDPRGLFPISAYNLPDKTKDLNASLKIIEKGGINIIINSNFSWMPDPYKLNNAFEELENSDLRWLVILENECKDDFIYFNSNNETNNNIRKYLKEFNDEFVYGWYIWDEPGNNRKFCTPFNLFPNDDYKDIDKMSKQIRSDSVFSKKIDYVNLFPTYWSETPTSETYENYIDAFINAQEYKPRLLSFDHYPLLNKDAGDFRRDYYLNLNIIRKKSIEYNIPFWIVVLSSGHYNYKNPTFEEISFQVFSALAYGAKGIGYYLYSKSWEEIGYKSWILENYVDSNNVVDSLYGPLFHPVKKLNAQIQILGKKLLELESIELVHSSEYPNKQLSISESLLKNKSAENSLIRDIKNTNDQDSDPKILIGILKPKKSFEGNKTYLLIVNKDVTNLVNSRVTLDGIYSIFELSKNNGETNFVKKGNSFLVNILPGSGRLFYLE